MRGRPHSQFIGIVLPSEEEVAKLLGRIDSLEQRVADGSVAVGHRLQPDLLGQDAPGQAVAVGVQPGRGQADDDVAGLDGRAVDEVGAGHHADREAGVEHYAIHKPLHTSTTYGYTDTRELIDVFQGKPGYTYARQGNPTTAALEAKITMMEAGVATACFATGVRIAEDKMTHLDVMMNFMSGLGASLAPGVNRIVEGA